MRFFSTPRSYAPVCAAALFFAVSTLSGCANRLSTERGQQYHDGTFAQVLTPVTQVDSGAPYRNDAFDEQVQQVMQNSPRLAAQYGALYDHLQQWVASGHRLSQLPQFKIETEQLAGKDNYGNVLFTGYFSPVIELRHQPDATYKYPLYAMPNCSSNCPTRAEIYAGALDGQGLELGYSASLIDNFLMEVQGSGFVHYDNDPTLHYLAYAGKNNHPYVAIGRRLIAWGEVPAEKMSLRAIKEWVDAHPDRAQSLMEENPSFVFFEQKNAHPVVGSAGIPLIAGASVAADRSIFPMGSVILAEVPLLLPDGTWSGYYQLKLMVALDTGGAVKNSHFDLYHGMGEQAGIDAGHYKHFGRVWKVSLAPSAETQISQPDAASSSAD
ncbi:Membrane-bound lytic murein transglycosylase A [Vibrio stylophorae]|uniref:peptidoglycan lytic exotransglycosylase n=1 Tax=Vibrio stylophorae TaxID=659351 RepID=A0ABM8ZVA6_9VIBR|nr:murein transglycosylase A [Vibrio stylophorae]CAH0534263.1 Membrane-bound lytic murein transglycosylase A [Vibrio stylophorae]